MEFGIKNTIPFILAPPKVKYLGIGLAKCVEDLYEESYQRTKYMEIYSLLMGEKISVLPFFPT